MLLPGDWPVGDPLGDHLAIADDVLEFEITSNRPDCQSVFGIAREVSAVLDTDLAPWPGRDPDPTAGGSVDEHVTARIEAPDLCPRWAGRVFTGVRVGQSPPWLKARIAAAGMRPISNVVDITNYVMLAVGEPTHAFDLDRVAGREIVVRRARDREQVTTLDGQDRVLDAETLVIADAERPSAIAGLMGAEWSEVTDETRTVLLECANFDGPAAQRASIRLGLRTEGSSRWEKGLDPHLVPRALALASQLMVELTGAQLVPGTIDLHGDLPEPPVVGLRRERLERLIGIAYTDEDVTRSLTRLGYEPVAGVWRVPTWRADDTTREADLIEEVARVTGIERVPAAMPGGSPGGGGLGRDEPLRRLVSDVLRGAGMSEAATLTLWDTGVPDRLLLPPDDPARTLVELENPMSAEWAAMRTLVFPGLLHSARRNLAMGVASVALFEIGHVFLPGEAALPDQPARVAGVLAGTGAGLFEAKGVVEALAAATRAGLPAFTRAERPYLHPGRSTAAGGAVVGELHPLVAEAFGLDGPVAVFEIPLEELRGPPPQEVLYRDVTTFPPLRQDIAVVVAEDVPAGRVVDVIRTAAGEHLASAEVFDVYRGEQAGEGRKSLAVHLVFQAADRTLTDAEAAAARERIVAALAADVGGALRA
jgi:phenylalanyl-tRNA synthetase beta chain